MIDIAIYSLFTLIIYSFCGQIFSKLNINSLSKICICLINGSILLSFIAVLLNFFFPLNILNNSLIFLIIIFIFLIQSKKYKINYILFFKYLIFICSLCFILIFLADANRPDAGLYHFPFIGLIANEKISFGITNINSRFGTISILQYLQALNQNYLTNINGMIIPPAIIAMTIYTYFFSEIIKSKTNYIYNLFLIFSLIFFTYKMNRYGEYGNDYIPHFMIFFLVSLILKYKNKISLNYILLLCIFSFTLKITSIFIFLLLPLLLFKYKKKLKFNKTFIISFFIFFIWMIKNIIHSGCFIWPIQQTCIAALEWFNSSNNYNNVTYLSLINELWAKGWPDNSDKTINQFDYLKNFNWFSTWINNHGLKIIKILSFYLLFVLLIFAYKKKELGRGKKIETLLKNLIFIFFIGNIIWFLKFPVYRFGISNLVIFLILFLIILFYQFNIRIKKESVVILSFICITILVMKNSLKIKNFNDNYNNYPWPKYYSFDKKNEPIKHSKVFMNNEDYYLFAKGLCMYATKICNNTKPPNNLAAKKYLQYKIYFLKNSNE